jgi:RNA polymerase sigma factor (sigma-70 family)
VSEIRENREADKCLVGKVLGGDTNAFAVIINQTEGLVTQIIFKMIRYSEDRKDIAQDVYLKAFRNLPGFRHQSKLSTWVAQIAYHTCLSFLEKKREMPMDQLHANRESGGDSVEMVNGKMFTSLSGQTENELFQRELKELLQSEIERLSPIHRTLITLYHHEDLSYGEIAVITALPEGTVKNYLFRARKSLKDNLLRQYKKEEL